MIRITVRRFNGSVPARGKTPAHAERVERTTWWLFWLPPICISDEILDSNL